MMATAESLLNVARSKIGLGENPPGSNRNEVTEWYGMNAAWCNMFVSWCLSNAGFGDGNVVSAPGIQTTTRKGWAYTGYCERSFRAAGRFDGQPRVGSFPIFDYEGNGFRDHIGIVESVNADGTITSIEGNYKDSVMRVRRRVSGGGIVGFCHPPYDGSPGSTPGLSGGLLRRGSRGPEVRELQERLTSAGVDPGPIDGDFGPTTENAVRAFQQARGLEVDGVVGPQTWGALRGSVPPTAPVPAPAVPPFPGVLRLGSRGAGVRQLQQRLSERGLSPGPVDGDFGPKTDQVTRQFQGDQGVAVDGIVGPITWGALWR